MDYLDRAVYRSNPRLLLDGSTENVFSYSEVYDGDKDVLLSYVRKNIDPGDPGRIGGNRDVLDFSAFFAMRDNLSSPGTANAWFNVRESLLDLHDDGLHNGSAGVLFVRSHENNTSTPRRVLRMGPESSEHAAKYTRTRHSRSRCKFLS